MTGKVRKRNARNKKETTKKDGSDSAKNAKDEAPPPPESESAWQTVSSHWMIRYMLPLYLLYAVVQGHWSLQQRILQNPESIERWVPFSLRAPVGHQDERQLLVVGTMSSGTRQISESLHAVFGLEMGHEMSDTLSNFVRDGTVSWIFGIRFLEAPPVLQIAELCQQATFAVGFHPRMYRGDICSQNQQWSKCWAQECVDILETEWGCALRDGCTSFQPFRRTLHQTRKPIAVIESLVAKFCVQAEAQKDFRRISSHFFHQLEFDKFSCLEAVSHHVIEYNRDLLRAREKGLIHGMYKIEQATPCEVAELASMDNPEEVVYPPNLAKYEKQCGHFSDLTAAGHQSMKPKWKYKVNQDRVRYGWTDFEGGKHGSNRPAGDMSLVDELKELTRDLGYGTEA